MDNKKIGDFISSLRKERNLTQKELAERLGVTDKAVSKWERGAGYPDISILKPLADVLGTTVNELLEGKAYEHPEGTESVRPVNNASKDQETNEKQETSDQDTVTKALNYASRIIKLKERNIGKLLAAIVAILLLIGIFTSVIVDVAVTHSISWSLIVIASSLLAGCLFLPPLLYKKRGLLMSLGLLTILIMPFLSVIQAAVSQYGVTTGWLWSLAFPISTSWLAILWLMVLVFKKRIRIWFYISIGAFLCIPAQIITNYAVDLYTHSLHSISNMISTVSTVIGLLAIAGICIVVGLAKRKPIDTGT